MGKQGYEDYLRHKEDERVNKRMVRVMRRKQLCDVKSENIKVCYTGCLKKKYLLIVQMLFFWDTLYIFEI